MCVRDGKGGQVLPAGVKEIDQKVILAEMKATGKIPQVDK